MTSHNITVNLIHYLPLTKKVLAEDKRVNRMQESLQLFATVVNNEFLKLKPFILFFNKKDLFEEKITKKNITVNNFPIEFVKSILIFRNRKHG